MPAGFSLRNYSQAKEQKNLGGIPVKILAHGSVDSDPKKTTNPGSEDCSTISKIDMTTEDQESDESTLIIVD